MAAYLLISVASGFFFAVFSLVASTSGLGGILMWYLIGAWSGLACLALIAAIVNLRAPDLRTAN